jgi:hypothetical protein
MDFPNSPSIVPLGAFLVAIVAIVSSAVSKAHARRIRAEQRMVMLQRGMTVEQIDQVLAPESARDAEDLPRAKDPLHSLANARRTGVVLVSVGIGLSIFGFLLSTILQVREILVVSAAGLIPLAIGIGFFIDYSLQKRELSRFGLEVGADPPSQNQPR